MKNSEPWFNFLSEACPNGIGGGAVHRSETSEGFLFLDLISHLPHGDRKVRFTVCLVDAEGLARPIHSGEVSSVIALLDVRLQSARMRNPALPLLVAACPDRLWPRSQAWMLGEYLAERDLPFWVDLRGLPEDRALRWMERLQETGLTCPRVVLEIAATEGYSPPPSLEGSGAWIGRFRAETGGLELRQI